MREKKIVLDFKHLFAYTHISFEHENTLIPLNMITFALKQSFCKHSKTLFERSETNSECQGLFEYGIGRRLCDIVFQQS
jgi:hypothetical protein